MKYRVHYKIYPEFAEGVAQSSMVVGAWTAAEARKIVEDILSNDVCRYEITDVTKVSR